MTNSKNSVRNRARYIEDRRGSSIDSLYYPHSILKSLHNDNYRLPARHLRSLHSDPRTNFLFQSMALQTSTFQLMILIMSYIFMIFNNPSEYFVSIKSLILYIKLKKSYLVSYKTVISIILF